jgi:hypothetical protein
VNFLLNTHKTHKVGWDLQSKHASAVQSYNISLREWIHGGKEEEEDARFSHFPRDYRDADKKVRLDHN